MRRTSGTSSPGGGGVFGRKKLFGNSRCEVLCQFAEAVSIQPALTGEHSLSGLEIIAVYLSWFWRLRKSKVRVLRDSASGEGLIPVSSHGGRVREPCGSFYQDTNPMYADSTLMT